MRIGSSVIILIIGVFAYENFNTLFRRILYSNFYMFQVVVIGYRYKEIR